ncbi:MAG: UvrD-helicase domain-containing protein [Prevotellaceae bacterium]|jgi:ATP-dependent exoDNAse (exonuclease V) beta subunit|nr:UvrD-helicase domain-containing protein [Prevotellaceae bacterium]
MELTVYKASAGSGKTYMLASEYLRLALAKPNSQRGFRSILAVTFTNKATEKMKSRILSLLHDIANGKQQDLASELAKRMKCSLATVQQKALDVRGAILHDYSHFSIVTIDKFFQQILQAFVREAGLRPGYTLELDTERLLEEAIVKVMDDAGEDDTLRSWILRITEENVDEGKSWDIMPKLRVIGKEIFSEIYLYFSKEFREKLADKSILASYLKNIKQLIDDFELKMKAIGNRAINYIESFGLSIADFKYKESGVAGYFVKLKTGKDYQPTSRAYKALGEVNEWSVKNSDRNKEVGSAFFELNNLLNEALSLWDSKGVLYSTAKVLIRNFMLMGLLSDISRNIQQISNEENILPISSSGYLLSQLIGKTDTPFIYEKAGIQFNHFMIDEFQDTSTGQWHNFRPLLLNSLSEGYINMVVGDVKQSIYRWRNGDWRILGYRLNEDFSTWGIKEQELKANWRSNGIIIRYNNELFSRLSKTLQANINNELSEISIPQEKKELLQGMIETAYNTVKQEFSPKTNIDKGYVSLKIIENTEEKKSTEIVLDELPLLIADLQDRGYMPNDIAILVRRGIEGQQVADTLLSYKQQANDNSHCFDVVSQDSLFIANASIVKLIISIFRFALNPNDHISETYIHLEIAKRKNSAAVAANHHEVLNSSFYDNDIQFIKSLLDISILDAFELIIQHFELNQNTDDIPFLQELHDTILNFSSDRLADLASFLQWWDETGNNKVTLIANDKQEAIKILTIHKSKGLQFKAVIVPFCTWSLVPNKDSILWLSPQVEPFNEMEHIPVRYGKSLANTIFYEDYFNEKTQSYVDNLNLLYVAFTRAEEELYAMIPQPIKKQGETVGTLLEETIKVLNSENIIFGELNGALNENKLTFGKKEYVENTDNQASEQTLNISSYPSSPIHNKLKIRYEAHDFFNSADDEISMTPRSYGNLMHRLFCKINTAEDISSSINQLIEDGLLEEKDKLFYTKKVEKALLHPIVHTWFTNSWTLKTETEFLLPKQKKQGVSIQRPDRVMISDNEAIIIDYKFGTLELPSYQKQMRTYIQGLQQMGYAKVKGFIWYIDTEKIVEVSL